MIKRKIYQGKLNDKLIDFTCIIQISAAPKGKKLRTWATTHFEELSQSVKIFKFISAKLRESDDQNFLVRNFVNPLLK